MVQLRCPEEVLIGQCLPLNVDDFAIQSEGKEGTDPVMNTPVDSKVLKLLKKALMWHSVKCLAEI